MKKERKNQPASQPVSHSMICSVCIIQFTHTKYHTLVLCALRRVEVCVVWHTHFIFIMSSSWLTVHYVQMCHANQKWNEFTLSPNDAKTSERWSKKQRNEEKPRRKNQKLCVLSCQCAAHIHTIQYSTQQIRTPMLTSRIHPNWAQFAFFYVKHKIDKQFVCPKRIFFLLCVAERCFFFISSSCGLLKLCSISILGHF